MKKIVLGLLAAGLAAGMLAGCGESTGRVESGTGSQMVSSEASSGSQAASEVSSAAEQSSAVSDVSSAVSSQESSAASSQPSSAASSKPASSAASSKPASSKPASSAVASKPPVTSSKPSSSTSSAAPAATKTPQEICKAIASAYGSDYYPDGEMPAEYIYGNFPVDKSLVDKAYGEMSMISINPDNVIVMKAVSGKGAQLESAMKAARDQYVAKAMIYPKDEAKLHASRVVRSGDYVAFIMLGAADDVNDDVTTSAAQKFAQDQIAIGVQAFQNAAK